MKWNSFIVICFLTFLLTTGCSNSTNSNLKELNTGNSTKLTINIVRELAKKGDKLSWEDFKIYNGKSIGSGLYIMEYAIDDKYVVLIGGGHIKEKPLYIRLINRDKIDTDKGIDIRYEEIDTYINKVS